MIINILKIILKIILHLIILLLTCLLLSILFYKIFNLFWINFFKHCIHDEYWWDCSRVIIERMDFWLITWLISSIVLQIFLFKRINRLVDKGIFFIKNMKWKKY